MFVIPDIFDVLMNLQMKKLVFNCNLKANMKTGFYTFNINWHKKFKCNYIVRNNLAIHLSDTPFAIQ